MNMGNSDQRQQGGGQQTQRQQGGTQGDHRQQEQAGTTRQNVSRDDEGMAKSDKDAGNIASTPEKEKK
jgi:hypothetical protein